MVVPALGQYGQGLLEVTVIFCHSLSKRAVLSFVTPPSQKAHQT